MKYIPIRNSNLKAIVSDKDFARVSKIKWNYWSNGRNHYAQKHVGNKILMMHQVVKPGVPYLDHLDGNGLNNVRSNLRPCTRSQNAANSNKRRNGITSIFKGVHFSKREGSFAATIRFNYKQLWLGYFKNERDAALAYNRKAVEIFGRFAKINTI